ncbi:MAG: hypothetical protein JW808_00510 [Victivallales bacterium]|nr:hypothetical protein [Victivallales bacterium]
MRHSVCMRRFFFFAGALFFVLSSFGGEDTYEGVRWYRGIVRVNTDVSSGTRTIEEVAGLAQETGLDFVVFSDQLLVRCEYGIPPFRRVFKIHSSRPSVLSHGVGEYLSRISLLRDAYPGMVFIPGADIAPHYYWHGVPFSGDFESRRFSQQLTVFGPAEPCFYEGIPVIHNEAVSFSIGEFLKFLPLLLTVWGLFLLKFGGGEPYRDLQGNSFSFRPVLGRRIFGCLLAALGVVWTLDNRPFSIGSPFGQYADHGSAPYQHVIDHVRIQEPDAAVFWSAPEAEMRIVVEGVQMHSLPYLDDVARSRGHNGFAGIYGDAYTAHQPGGLWDKMLLEYCSGERSERPVVIGELDYHGHDRGIDVIQTVVQTDDFSVAGIVAAIRHGRSYALSKPGAGVLNIHEAVLVLGDRRASLGETLLVAGDASEGGMVLRIRGEIESCEESLPPADLTVVGNGEGVYFKRFHEAGFALEIPLLLDSCEIRKGYVRFWIDCGNVGRVMSNPIFYAPEPFGANAAPERSGQTKQVCQLPHRRGLASKMASRACPRATHRQAAMDSVETGSPRM